MSKKNIVEQINFGGSFNSTKIIKNAMDKVKANKKIEKDVETYVKKNQKGQKINKDLTIDKSAEGKAKYKALKQKKLEASIKKIRETEPENQSKEFGPEGQPSASVQIKKARLAGKTGVERAQELAKMRIASGKTIQKVKDDKKMHSIERKNRDRFGDSHIDKLKAKNKAFQSMKRGEITKQQFMKDFPKSITAQKEKGLRDQTEWDAYEIVLEYLLSTEQVATIEEANYVMTEMDAETIQSIISD